MTILQLNVSLKIGSTGRIVQQIGAKIKNEGYESYIGYSRSDHTSETNSIKIGSTFDSYWHVFNTRIFDTHGFHSKNATIRFIDKVKSINPDVIHLHNLHGYYIHVGILFDFLNELDIPIVWTFHDCWPFTGHCAYFDRVDCQKWQTGCYQCPLKGYYPSSWLIDNSKLNYSAKKKYFGKNDKITIVTPSKWLKGHVKKSFFKNNRVEVINNGVDLTTFKPSSGSINLQAKFAEVDTKIILGVANIWDDRKGLQDFIKLNEILPEDFKIVLVGLSKKQVNTLPNGIIGIQRTKNLDELVDLYSHAHIYVNPTYSDNFPTTNIEALACGTPVVTYNTGGSPEALDETTGMIVEKGDITALLNSIRTILSSNSKYTKDLCRQRAVEFFDANARFNDYIDLYNTLLKK